MTREEFKKKWKIGEEENSSPSSSKGGAITQRYLREKYAKTYEEGASALNDIYSGWQSPEQGAYNMDMARNAIKSLSDMGGQYGDTSFDNHISTLVNNYLGADDALNAYSGYVTADAYNKAQKKFDFANKYRGASYDDIQKALASATDIDEQKFLKRYTDYSSLEDFDKAIEAEEKIRQNVNAKNVVSAYQESLKEARNKYEAATKYDKYAPLVNDEDFEKYSDPTQILNAEYGMDTDFYKENKKLFDRGIASGSFNAVRLSDMNEEMQRMGAYIYNTQGEEAYLEYMREMTDYVRNEQANAKAELWSGYAENHPVATTIGSTLLQPIVGGLAGVDQALSNASGYKSVSPLSGLSSAMSGATSEISQRIKEENGGLPAFAYDVFTTGVPNRIGQAMFGSAYNIVMGLSSFSTTYANAVQQGTDPDRAVRDAFVAGAIEYLTEQIGMDWAFGKGKNVVTTILKQAFAEGSEEVVGAVAQAIYDAGANGAESEYNQNIQKYIEMGYSRAEAIKKAQLDFAKDVAYQFAVAAFSTVPTTGAAEVRRVTQESSAGKFVNREKMAEITDEKLQKKYGEEWAKKATNREIYKAYGNYVEGLQNESTKAKKEATRKAIAEEYKMTEDQADKWVEALYNGDKKLLKTGLGAMLTNDVRQNKGFAQRIDSTETDKIATKIRDAFNMIKSDNEMAADKASKAIKTGEKNLVNGKEAEIISMKENKDGSYTVKTSEGNVNASDVTVTENKATALTYSANIENEIFKEAYVRYYKGQDIADYDTYARYLYQAGRQGVDYSDETQILDTLGVARARAFYNIGASEALQEEIAEDEALDKVRKKYAEKFRPGTFKSGEYKNGKFKENKDFFRNLNRTQKKLYRIVESFSVLSGINVRVYIDREAASENGQFIAGRNGGTIYINLAARPFGDSAYGINQYVISTLSHELTHWLKANNREAYDILEEAVKKDLQKNKTLEKRLSTERETLLKTHENELKEAGKSEEEIKAELEKYSKKKDLDEIAMEEVVARACEDMLNNSDTMEEVLSFADQDGLTKLQNALKKWFDHIRQFFNDLMGGFHAPNEVVADLQKSYDHLRELWVNGMKEAIAQNRREQKTTESKNTIKDNHLKSTKLSSMGYTDQEHTSAGTSLKQNASTFTTYQFDDGERILDWGGGRYDISKRVVEKSYNNVTFEAVDQFNRTEEHNSRVLKEFAKDKATSLTINNVFNVIDSEATIESILAESKKYLKDDGMCYIHIYTGNRSGIGKETSAGYQRNETADKYEKYVKKYYKNVRRAGDFILASDGEIKVKKLDEAHKNLIKKNTESVSKMDDLDMRESRYSTKIEYGTITDTSLKDLFINLNPDKEMKALGEKVFDAFHTMQRRAIESSWDYPYAIYFLDTENYRKKAGLPDTAGEFSPNGKLGTRGIIYNTDYMNGVSDNDKARIILHEVIHAVTVNAIRNAQEYLEPRKMEFISNPQKVTEDAPADNVRGGIALIGIYNQIRKDGADKYYGCSSVYEMVAELANPEFRGYLKKQSLWGKIIDAIKKILGLKDNAYDASVDALEMILSEYAPKTSIRNSVRLDSVETIGAADVDTKTGTAVYSVRYTLAERYKELGYNSYAEAVGKTAADIAEKMGVSKLKAEQWIKAEESLASLILKDAENQRYLDYVADDRYSAIKTDTDYPQGTIDLSNLCRKREIFTKMFDSLQRENPDILFTAEDIAKIRQILTEANYEVACALCYVEDRRQKIGEISQSFIDNYKKALGSKTKVIYRTNSKGKVKPLKITKKQAATYGLTQGDYFKAVDPYIPNQYDLTTYQGYKELTEKHPMVAAAFENFNNARGQSAARLIEGHAEYKREILNWSEADVNKANNLGGLRVFSFSDFEAIHLIDIVQVVMDCSAKGVMIQAYTKVPSFANLVKDTGIKLNRSLIPANVGSKNAYAYVNGKAVKIDSDMWVEDGIALVNGKEVLAFDTVEGIDITDENFLDMSDNKNVGNILVGISEKQIKLAMKDNFVDYIIPFHSNQAKSILEAKGIHKWDNFKLSQLDKKVNGKGKDHGINIYTDVINKYKIRNKNDFVRAFLNECKNQKYKPRFAEFLNKNSKGDYIYTEGYHKFLVDYKLFDKNGNILKQEAVKPDFDQELMNKILMADKARSMNMKFSDEIMDKVRNELSNDKRTVKSVKLDSEYMSAVNKGDLTTAQKMVDQAANEAGYTIKGYHGTDAFGFTQFKKTDDGFSFFFSANTDIAKTYVTNNTLASPDVDIKAIGKISDYSKPKRGIKYTEAELRNLAERYNNEFRRPYRGEIKINVEKQTARFSEITSSAYSMASYIYYRKQKGIYDTWLKMEKPLVLDGKGENWSNIDLGEIAGSFNEWWRKSHPSLTEDDFFRRANTRSIAQYAHEHGYDGIIIKNIYDDGNRLKFHEPVAGDIYAVFNASQIKSADPVTYDNEGNVIPLSERFDDEKKDIRFSTKMDSTGRTLTPGQQDFFKNSKARDDQGRLLVMFHGSKDFGFTVFNPDKSDDKRSLFFTDSKGMASTYVEDKDKIYEVYLNLQNPFILDAHGGYWNGIIVDEDLNMLDEAAVNIYNYVRIVKRLVDYDVDIQDALLSLGEFKDSVEFFFKEAEENDVEYTEEQKAEFLEAAERADESYRNWNEDEHLDENGEPQSLADYINEHWITSLNTRQLAERAKERGYDGVIIKNVHDNGKFWRQDGVLYEATVAIAFDGDQVKAVTNENPTKDKDIHKSVKMDSNGKTLTPGQQNYFKDSKVVDDQGRLLVVYHGTNEEFDTFRPNDFIGEINGVNRIVGWFSEDKSYSEIYGSTKAYYLNIKNPLVLDETAKTLDNWEKFFKQNGVTNVIFDSSVSGKNGQVDPIKGGKFEDGTYYTYFELLDMGNYWYGDGNLTERIQAAGYDGIQTNDEYEKAWMPFNTEAVKSVDNENPTDNPSTLKSTKLPPEAQRLVDELTLENKRLTEENTALKAEKGIEKAKAEKKAIIDKITEQSQVLSRWLLTNDKNNPVPQSIKEPLGRLLTSINFTKDDYEWRKSKGHLTKAEESLGQRMAKISQLLLEIDQDKVVDKEAYDLSQLDWLPTFSKEFVQIKDAVAKAEASAGETFTLSKMSTEDLQNLSNMITALKTAITNMNKCMSAHNKMSVSGIGRAIVDYLDEVGQKKIDNRALQFLEIDNTVPFYFFKRLGSGGQTAFKLLMDGMNQYAFEAKLIEDYAKETFSGKDVNAWRDQVKTFEIDQIEYSAKQGEDLVQSHKTTIRMTVPQIMSLYCLSKRDQAQNHLQSGGIRVGDFRVKSEKEPVRQVDNVTLTKADLQKIISSLDEDQKNVADKLQEFMNTTLQKWGNEVTMKRFGFKGMTEKNYFPIAVDRNVLSSQARQKGTSLYQLLNMGFTKPINPKAKNPIEIFDIFEVFAMHSTEMAQYHSLALPVLDVIRIWNYKDLEMLDEGENKAHWNSVKASIENTIGAKGNAYIGRLLADLNGDVSGGRADDLASRFMKNYKTAAVAANLQVAALQPLSYIRAGYMIDSKYLTKGMAMKSTDDALKWCGIAVWKDMGFYNTAIHRGLEHKIMQDETKKESIIEKGLYLAGKADGWTWSKLWNACLLETKDNYPNLEGDDLYKKTADRLTEVIYGTQVVDSILTRSEIMRDPTFYSKMITAFQSEPTLALNVLMDAGESFAMEARAHGKQAALQKHGATIRRAATIYLISSAVESALRAVIGKIRGYDGDDDDETIVENFLKRFIEELNPLRKIPLIKDAWAILIDGIKVVMGKQYRIYTDTRMDEAIFENIGKSVIRMFKLIEGKEANFKALYEIAKGLDASGLPVSSTFRAFKVLWNNTIGRIWESLLLK